MTNMNICACMYTGIFVHVCTKTTLVFLSLYHTTLVYYFHVFFVALMYVCTHVAYMYAVKTVSARRVFRLQA